MTSVIAKRSIVIGGHKTSISLEDPFWQALQRIAHGRETSVSRLISEIDKARDEGGNLSSAIRVFILEHYLSRADALAPTERPRSLLDQIRKGDGAGTINGGSAATSTLSDGGSVATGQDASRL
jgi:predicted DNA-binding ribbon-helix-helix protein